MLPLAGADFWRVTHPAPYSLPRPMPTDWDNCYRDGNTPWDKGAAAPPLLEWLEAPEHRLTGAVLVPGCGLGHDVRAIAAAGQSSRVVGLDISAAALVQARSTPATGGETYVQADLFALPPELRGCFDWVFEHTCFCAIDPLSRAAYVGAVAAALGPAGHLLAVFYLNPWNAGEAPPPGGGPPFPSTREELDGLFAGSFELLDEAVPTRAYRGREGREVRRLYRKA